jgi:phenylalanyl-tRNA synthetase beta chain
VELRPERVAHVLGIPFDTDRITALLEPLGFTVQHARNGVLSVRVPGHRRYDVSREVDLIEEVARRHGYERFPDELRAFRSSVVPDDAMAQLEDHVRDRLTARGFLEARTMPLVQPADGDVALLHPLSATESTLRRALLPGLVRRLETNYNRGARDVRLFEIGTTFAPGGADGRPREATRLAVLLTGARSPQHWTGDAASFDVWDLRGVMEEVAAILGGVVEPGRPSDAAGLVPFDPQTLLRARTSDAMFGAGGRILEQALDAPAWAETIWGAEFTLSTAVVKPALTFRPLPTQPAVDRDIALVVARTVPASSLEATIRAAAGELLESVRPFDLYEGSGLAEGWRSLAFRLRFRAADRTLTVGEVDALMERVLESLRNEHNAERR